MGQLLLCQVEAFPQVLEAGRGETDGLSLLCGDDGGRRGYPSGKEAAMASSQAGSATIKLPQDSLYTLVE